MPFRFSNPSYSIIPFSCVRDSRKRYRDPDFGSDLAAVLATFNYTKETLGHDHIYAPMALVKKASVYEQIILDYKKSLGSVFLKAATYIIMDRQDLYLWGTKSLYTRRTMKDLPSWVPEWTGLNCEEAIEYYRNDLGELYFSSLLRGNHLIQGYSLYVNAHILDQIDLVAPIGTDEQRVDLFARLETHLMVLINDSFTAAKD
ncbi:hypothetical protein K469DRAFT_49888 [Zopfia rhizophila CBS 207.26]|uniref:Heterokaryon incompatibility domain-containing protein n=1 Tax=Zopfia rhizophila CBS 207.26 TaxID=1314779 RepID=A0A6A6EGU3_9PEZI|nr:hypothetical protein K469DRAFT_49888 [Zopfia rhizophila CBS 207.26]